MTLRTHNSSTLRTTTEAQGNGVQGSVTVSISVGATLTRERTVFTDVSTRVYPAATMEYSEPGIGDIIFTGIDNTTSFGTLGVQGGSITVSFTGFTNSFVVNEDGAVGREFGVVEGWQEFEGFENPAATFGDLDLIQELYVSLTGFTGSDIEFPDLFMVELDIVYDLDANVDASGDLVFGDLEAFFGLVEDNWIEDDPTSNTWGRIT